MPGKSVLFIADRGAGSRQVVRDTIGRLGLQIVEVEPGPRVSELAQRGGCDLAIIETASDESIGPELVVELKAIDPDLQFTLIRSNDAIAPSDEPGAGAFGDPSIEYVPHPIDADALARAARYCLERRRLLLEIRRLKDRDAKVSGMNRERFPRRTAPAASPASSIPFLVGQSEAVRAIRRKVGEVARSDMTVLLLGESGTGKDVVARLIHTMSGRADTGSYVKINCPAIPEQLLESELFGHEAGAFTSAQKQKPGQFEMAYGGSIFLDEIGEMPLSIQSKLLQVFDHKQFMRLGGKRSIEVDARIIAATNTSLEQLVEDGGFRLDLYYRLNQYLIQIPPLRERSEDIPLLVDYFLKKYGPAYGRDDLAISSEMMSRLMDHAWPGNVRELESQIRRFALTGKEASIHCPAPKATKRNGKTQRFGMYQDYEKRAIVEALTKAKWNRRKAAQMLNISYNTLRRRIVRYKLDEALEPTLTR